MKITATYSPEDNKIRLYASARLDSDTYAKVKAAGFKWAPKQELFVAPCWSYSREALAIELAGEIEAEQSTMAERAEAKAERLEALAERRAGQANAFSRAAQGISQRFEFGQPILIGHHSERSARKDRERMDSLQSKAIKAQKAVGHWIYKANGALATADHKNRADVRARRIKTLLAELRDDQRTLANAQIALQLLEKMTTDAQIERCVGMRLKHGDLFYWTACDDQRKGMPLADIRAKAIANHQRTLTHKPLLRAIEHTLSRLSYERELLGPVRRFTGELRAVTLQEFAREHGAHDPKGTKNDDGTFTLESRVCLPMHIADGDNALTLDVAGWLALMESCGYEAQLKAEAKSTRRKVAMPLLNIDTDKLFTSNPYSRDGKPREWRVHKLTKAEFAKLGAAKGDVRVSACKTFRFRTMYIGSVLNLGGEFVAVFITDSKAHPMPTASA